LKTSDKFTSLSWVCPELTVEEIDKFTSLSWVCPELTVEEIDKFTSLSWVCPELTVEEILSGNRHDVTEFFTNNAAPIHTIARLVDIAPTPTAVKHPTTPDATAITDAPNITDNMEAEVIGAEERDIRPTAPATKPISPPSFKPYCPHLFATLDTSETALL
jgi:hypothetical protein